MRRVDADALKEELELSKYIIPSNLNRLLNSEINRCIEAIDNAPTVEAIPTELHEKILDKVEGELLECQSNLRPQGEWIITKDEKLYWYKCPFCGFWATGDFLRTNGNLDLPNFCEKCGADMRGDKE